MRKPIPVITRIITELRGSRKKPHCAPMEGSQRNWITSWVFSGVPVSCATAPIERRREMKMAPGQRIEITVFGRRLPSKGITAAPARGIRGMSQMRSRKFIVLTSPFQNVDFIGQHRSLVAEQRDENAQADRGLGDGHR